MSTVIEKFQAKYIPVTESGCWLWFGANSARDYGDFWFNGKMRRAHRVSWELAHGPIPPGMFVCHTCDVPSCVNPDHLFLGDRAANMRDCVKKGRQFPSRRTACIRGHQFTPDNVYPRKGVQRECKACIKLRRKR